MRVALRSSHPQLCLSLTESTLQENLRLVESNKDLIDLVELRADLLAESEINQLPAFPAALELPAVLTFRRKRDGGGRKLDERERAGILDRALEGGWAYVELEGDLDAPALEEKTAHRGTSVMRSLYDRERVPDNLAALIRSLHRKPSDIAKATVTPGSVSDLLRLLDAGENIRGIPAIVEGVGEWGFPTRVLPGRFSSVLTYCSSGRRNAAREDIDPRTLRRIYRFGEVSSHAELFCVIGNPVLHSRSPWIHNPAYRALGLDAVYVPIQVDSLPQFLSLADRLPIAGASVTVPHKEEVRTHLSEADASVTEAGACNTLVRGRAGWRGYNTDMEGFLAPLRDRLGARLPGKRALVIGAGGAARAAIAGLLASQCSVTIVNRTDRRASDLAARFGCQWSSMRELERGLTADIQIIVQATSAGMTPNETIDPLPAYRFRGEEIVYELIYSPPRTRFLERAAGAGCAIIEGREMLLNQAYAQFRLFTGRDYPESTSPEAF